MAKIKRNYTALRNLDMLLKDMWATFNIGVNVGWLIGTDPEVLKRVWKMEFAQFERGAEYAGWAVLRRTKLDLDNRLFDLVNEAFWGQNLRGSQMWHYVGEKIVERMREVLLETSYPQLTEYTITLKQWKAAQNNAAYRGIAIYGASQIFVETGESLESIDYHVVPAWEVQSTV